MLILLDTSIVLDVLLEQEPHFELSEQVWQACDNGQAIGYVTATTISDIYYIARKRIDLQKAHTAVQQCLEAFEICLVDSAILMSALALPGNDFEDNLQIACAQRDKLDGIVTRDKAGFKHSPIPVLTPAEALAALVPATE